MCASSTILKKRKDIKSSRNFREYMMMSFLSETD